MGNIEPLLGITKPTEGLNKPCQGNVNSRKSFAERFNVKILFISQAYTKAVANSFRQRHTRTRNPVKYHPRVVFTEDKTSHEICQNTAKSGSTVKSVLQFQKVPLFTVL